MLPARKNENGKGVCSHSQSFGNHIPRRETLLKFKILRCIKIISTKEVQSRVPNPLCEISFPSCCLCRSPILFANARAPRSHTCANSDFNPSPADFLSLDSGNIFGVRKRPFYRAPGKYKCHTGKTTFPVQYKYLYAAPPHDEETLGKAIFSIHLSSDFIGTPTLLSLVVPYINAAYGTLNHLYI